MRRVDRLRVLLQGGDLMIRRPSGLSSMRYQVFTRRRVPVFTALLSMTIRC